MPHRVKVDFQSAYEYANIDECKYECHANMQKSMQMNFLLT